MTPAQEARLDGFRAAQEQRGHWLRLNGAGDPVCALVETAAREQGQFLIQREVANASRVHLIRTDLVEAGASPKIGDAWHDSAGARYRVTRIEDQPVNIAVIHDCETVTV